MHRVGVKGRCQRAKGRLSYGGALRGRKAAFARTQLLCNNRCPYPKCVYSYKLSLFLLRYNSCFVGVEIQLETGICKEHKNLKQIKPFLFDM